MIFSNINTLKEHQGPVYALCQGESPKIIYSAGSDRKVIRWNLETMQAEKVVAMSPTTVISLLFLNQQNILLIGQVEGGVHMIDLNEGKEVKYLKLHQGYVFDMIFIKQKQELVLCSGDGSFSVWSLPDAKLLFHRKVGNQKIRKIDFSEDREELALALGDGKVLLLNVLDYSLKHEVGGFSSGVNVVKYSADSKSLWAGEKDALLTEVNLDSLIKSEAIAAHYWAIYDISIHSEEGIFATASRDKTVKIWDASKMEVLKRFEGRKDFAHTHSVNKLHWTSFQNLLISTGDDGSLKIWQVSTSSDGTGQSN